MSYSYHRACRGMYTHDGAGQPLLIDEVEDEIVRRLEEKGITPDDEEYDECFSAELDALQEEAVADYNDAITEAAAAREEDRLLGYYD